MTKLIEINRLSRPISLIITGTLVVSLACLAPREGRGQGNQVADADLLKVLPFDRITLIDNTVVEVETISPRPLPPFDPQKDDSGPAASKTKAKDDGQPPQGNVLLTPKTAKRKKDEQPQINEVAIHRLEGDLRDYRVRRVHIKKIEYYEDLLLSAGERAVVARDYAKAFEYYLAVKLRNPEWKGLDDHIDQLLFAEGTWSLAGEPDRGLRLLRELFERKPDYPGLADRLAEAYDGRIERAFKIEAYRDGRRILHELQQIAPKATRTEEARLRFVTRARAIADEAARAEGAEKLDRWSEALRVWPTLEGASEKYEEAFKAEPTLEVGVVDVPRPVAPWIRSRASARSDRLIYRPVLARDDEDSRKGTPADQVAAGLDVSDLGRRLIVRLREGVAWSDGSRDLAAMDLVRALSDRAEPRSPAFNARWADVLTSVEATDDHSVEIRLSRAPLRPEAWFLGPIGPAHASWDGWVAVAGSGRRPVGDGPFRWESEKPDQATYRASGDASAGSAKLRRVREVRLPSASAAVGALLRGEISLLEHVPPARLAGLLSEPDIKIGKYNRPTLHYLAIDGRNPALRNRALRRGLAAAIDRKMILEDVVLRHSIDPNNLPSDGPFPTDSYANAPDVRPFSPDGLTARALVTAARKELGKPIKLILEYPAIAEAQAAIPRIVEAFQLTGIEVKAISWPESELEEALRSGRKFDLAYRVATCAEPVMEAGPLLCPGYDARPSANGLGAIASDRILQLLLELEHTNEWPSARALLIQIDRESRDELPILPLWQLEDYYARRTRLTGPGESCDFLYQGIETWEIAPWFAKDPF